MGFLDEFDRRNQGLPPSDADLTPEERELLAFSDLIRNRQALPEAGEKARILERVRRTEASPRLAATPSSAPRKSNLAGGWIVLGAAAMFALAALIFLFSTKDKPPESSVVAHEKEVPVKPQERLSEKLSSSLNGPVQTKEPLTESQVTSWPARVAEPVSMPKGAEVAANADAEFADSDFPKPEVLAATGAAGVESEAGREQARILRVHGLCMYQPKAEKKWRAGERGVALAPGWTLRTSKRLDSSARLLGPDGTRISLGAGAVLRFDGPRAWSLDGGQARFEVAKRPDLPAFAVTTPQGTSTALGTTFTLHVVKTPLKDNRVGVTACEVEEGKVSLAGKKAGAAAPVSVEAGQVFALSEDGAASSGSKFSRAWLDILQAELEADHGIGQLIAKAEKEGAPQALEINSHRVTVTVVDGVARTFVDMVFMNNTDRRLEGTFYYPLPADATIGEFAMYVGDQRIVGEVLEQQRARQIFEYIVRQQRDPALLEFAGGNLFKMRVFPIEPKSEKRVQLGYTQILQRHEGLVTYTYPLYSEMLLKNPLRDLSLEFRVHASSGLENLASPSHKARAALTPDGAKGALGFRARNLSPTQDFSVTYRVKDGPECVAFGHRRADEDDTDPYVMFQLEPRMGLPRRPAPENLLVVVDGCSGNAKDYAIAAEFAATAADMSAAWEIGVLRGGMRLATGSGAGRRIGCVPYGEGKFEYASDDTAQKLREFLNLQAPLGSTDLLATFQAASKMIPAGKRVQLVYLGDGIDTSSELAGPALVQAIVALFKGQDVQVSTVAIGSNYDAPVLQGIAAGLNGTFTRIQGAAEVFQATDQVFESFYRPILSQVQVAFEGLEIKRLYPPQLGTIFAGDTAVLLGRLGKGTKGTLRVTGFAGEQVYAQTYPLEIAANAERNRFLPRLWAKAHIDHLLAQQGLEGPAYDAKLRQEVIATSLAYQIMSPFTAFLVLESEEDYQRFGIKRRMKMMDWKGELSGLEGRESGVAGKVKSETRVTALPLEMGAEVYAQEDEEGEKLGMPALGDHFETMNLERSESESERSKEILYRDGEYDDKLIAEKSSELSNDWEEIEGQLDQLRRSEELPIESDRPWNGPMPISGKKAARHSNYKRILSAQRYYSLVFTGGKVVDLEVDQPLRPAWAYQRIQQAGKGTLTTTLNLSLALEKEGKFAKALEALQTVLEKHPQLPALRLQEGVLKSCMGDVAGAKAAFAKAMELTPEKDRPALRQRLIGLWSSLGQNQECAEFWSEDLGKAAKPEEAVPLAQALCQQFMNAGLLERAAQTWDELLTRWPKHGPLLYAAGAWQIQNGHKHALGLERLRAARELGAPATVQAIQALMQHGNREEGWLEFERLCQAAANGDEIYLAFSGVHSYDGVGASKRARQMLASAGKEPQLSGALQFLSAYGLVRTRTDAEAVLAAINRAEKNGWTGTRLQASALQALVNAWNQGIRLEGAVEKVAAIFFSVKKDDLPQALQAVNILNGWKLGALAKELLENLRARKDLTVAQVFQLWQAEWYLLQQQGRQEEAEKRMAEAFTQAADENYASQAAQQLIYARIGRQAYDDAAKALVEFVRRYPRSFQSQYWLQYLLSNARQGGVPVYDKIVGVLAEGATEYPPFQTLKFEALTKKGKLREAAEAIREAIQGLEKPAPISDPKTEEKAESKAEPKAELTPDQRKAEAAQRQARKLRLISWLAQICGQDSGMRETFLKEAAEKAKAEDPGNREWTGALFTCLGAAGDVKGRVRKLEELAAAEPLDPLWPVRLAYAYVESRRMAEGRSLFEKLSNADPADGELAMECCLLSERMKDARGVETGLERYLAALDETQLQQQAYQWQGNRPEWSLRAWRRLYDRPGRMDTNNIAYAIGQLLQNSLRRPAEAIPYYSLVILKDRQCNQSVGAAENLGYLAQQEEYLRSIETELQKEPFQKVTGAQAVVVNLLRYRLEILKNREAAARAALDAATATPLGREHVQIASRVMNLLMERKSAGLAESYVRSDALKDIGEEHRRELLRALAVQCHNTEQERPRAIRIYREILDAEAPPTSHHIQELASWLIAAQDLSAAEEYLRKSEPGSSDYSLWNAWQQLTNAYADHGRLEDAVNRALEVRGIFKHDQSGYRQSAKDLLWNIFQVASDRKLAVNAKVRAVASQEILQDAQSYFSGEGMENQGFRLHQAVIESFGLRDTIEKLSREAAQSEDSRRVCSAAQYAWNRNRAAEAIGLYRRALGMEGSNRSQILSQLYNLYLQATPKPRWPDALETLESLRALKAHDDSYYLQERGRCLYGMNRKEEARAALEKLTASPPYLRNNQWWGFQNLAQMAAEFKDWEAAAQLYEKAIRGMSAYYRNKPDAGTISSLFGVCSNAYAQAGQPTQALDCLLRALSLVPREDSHYKEVLKQALDFFLKGRKLEEAVTAYERGLEQEAAQGKGGEKPQLRIAFGEGYRLAGDSRRMLAQWQIAANLLPKDMKLRKEVIEGYEKLEDHEAAIKAYLEWSKFDPQNLEAYQGLGDLLWRQNRETEALQAWATMPQVRPREAEGYRAYAAKLVQANFSEDAAAALRKAIRYRPTEHALSQELAAIYSKLGQGGRSGALWTEGEAACRKAIENLEDDPLPWLDLGRFLASQGKNGEARDLYLKILGRSWPRFQNETHSEARKLMDALPKQK